MLLLFYGPLGSLLEPSHSISRGNLFPHSFPPRTQEGRVIWHCSAQRAAAPAAMVGFLLSEVRPREHTSQVSQPPTRAGGECPSLWGPPLAEDEGIMRRWAKPGPTQSCHFSFQPHSHTGERIWGSGKGCGAEEAPPDSTETPPPPPEAHFTPFLPASGHPRSAWYQPLPGASKLPGSPCS